MFLTLPEGLEKYAETPKFTNQTVPKRLTDLHDTKPGVWGLLFVHKGTLEYTIPGPPLESKVVHQGDTAIIEPTILHKVTLSDDTEFSIEFHKEPKNF